MVRFFFVAAVVLTSAFAHAQEQNNGFVGFVEPIPQRHYRGSPENGYPITQIHVKPGDMVKKGQVVIELDPAVLPLNLRAAQVEVAKGDLAILLAKRETRQKLLERRQCLLKTNSTSLEDLDLATETMKCLDAEIARAKSALKAAQVAYDQADFVHTNYEVMKSPIAGEVVRLDCALGQCGRPEMKQVVWIEIIDSSVVQIRVSVPLKTAKSLKTGRPVVISQDGQTWHTAITTVTKMADDHRQIPVIIEMPNPSGSIICGTEVNVTIN